MWGVVDQTNCFIMRKVYVFLYAIEIGDSLIWCEIYLKIVMPTYPMKSPH